MVELDKKDIIDKTRKGIFCQVKKNKASGQLIICVNKKSGLKAGDEVELVKV